MHTELKKAIINHIFDHSQDFQIVNNTVSFFRQYIYDSKGNYIIGGEEVYNFIKNAIDLIK